MECISKSIRALIGEQKASDLYFRYIRKKLEAKLCLDIIKIRKKQRLITSRLDEIGAALY